MILIGVVALIALVPVSNDVVAYRLESDDAPCGVDIVIGARGNNPSLSWQQPVSHTGSQWKAAGADCILGDLPCTQEQEEDGFLTIDGACVPMCFRLDFYQQDGTAWGNIGDEYYDLYGDILQHVTIGKDEQCDGEAVDTSQDVNSDNDPNNDKKNEELYNILEITAQKTNFDTCCRRSKKTECPTNYESKTVAGQPNCYPNCVQAAEYAGYSQSNSQISPVNTACSAITPINTWKPVSEFYDPYNFQVLRSFDVMTPDNQFCCVKNEDPN